MPLKGKRADLIRIKHMVDAAEEARSFLKGRQRGDLNDDRQLLLSLVKEIEIIGEAAMQVSDRFKERHPELPWKEAMSMRNRLVHAYFDIDAQVVWETVVKDLPALIKQLQTILSKSFTSFRMTNESKTHFSPRPIIE